MLLTGLALKYDVIYSNDVFTTTVMPSGVDRQMPERVLFHKGACRDAIHEPAFVDVLLNHTRAQDLGSSIHGLFLFETDNGLYFYLRLPPTHFAERIYQWVRDGTIRHMCAQSTATFGHEDEDGVFTVRKADLCALSLLIAVHAHCPETWIAVANEETERRITEETRAAEKLKFMQINQAVRAKRAEMAVS